MNLNDVTSVVVSCLLLDLIRELFEGVQSFYPEHKFVIVDNGSHNESTEYILDLAGHSYVEAIINDRNLGHGPALHQGVQEVKTPLVFIWHSDVIVFRGGFLEPMVERFNRNANLFVCGDRAMTGRSREIPVALLSAMMLDKRKYAKCDPFRHGGAVSMDMYASARRQSFEVGHFPIWDYVTHFRSVTLSLLGTWTATPESLEQGRERLSALDPKKRWSDRNRKWRDKRADAERRAGR